MSRKNNKKSEFLSALGVMFEVWKAVVDAVLAKGGTDDDLRRIKDEPGLAEKLADLIVGAKKAACSFADLIPRGWTVVEDVAPTAFDISKLKPVPFLKQGESEISGEEMRKRAVEFNGNLGLADGQRMLAEQDKIPAEFRDYYIVLSGTVLRDSGGSLSVPFLYFNGGRWVLDFCWLDGVWGGLGRFARCE